MAQPTRENLISAVFEAIGDHRSIVRPQQLTDAKIAETAVDTVLRELNVTLAPMRGKAS